MSTPLRCTPPRRSSSRHESPSQETNLVTPAAHTYNLRSRGSSEVNRAALPPLPTRRRKSSSVTREESNPTPSQQDDAPTDGAAGLGLIREEPETEPHIKIIETPTSTSRPENDHRNTQPTMETPPHAVDDTRPTTAFSPKETPINQRIANPQMPKSSSHLNHLGSRISPITKAASRASHSLNAVFLLGVMVFVLYLSSSPEPYNPTNRGSEGSKPSVAPSADGTQANNDYDITKAMEDAREKISNKIGQVSQNIVLEVREHRQQNQHGLEQVYSKIGDKFMQIESKMVKNDEVVQPEQIQEFIAQQTNKIAQEIVKKEVEKLKESMNSRILQVSENVLLKYTQITEDERRQTSEALQRATQDIDKHVSRKVEDLSRDLSSKMTENVKNIKENIEARVLDEIGVSKEKTTKKSSTQDKTSSIGSVGSGYQKSTESSFEVHKNTVQQGTPSSFSDSQGKAHGGNPVKLGVSEIWAQEPSAPRPPPPEYKMAVDKSSAPIDFASVKNGARIDTGLMSWLYSYLPPDSNEAGWILRDDMNPGKCWGFPGSSSSTAIQFAQPIIIQRFSLKHAPFSALVSPDTAPKNFRVVGVQTNGEESLIGSFILPYHREDISIKLKDNTAYRAIRLLIDSNHGNPKYTCVYRIIVNGAYATA